MACLMSDSSLSAPGLLGAAETQTTPHPDRPSPLGERPVFYFKMCLFLKHETQAQ